MIKNKKLKVERPNQKTLSIQIKKQGVKLKKNYNNKNEKNIEIKTKKPNLKYQ